MADRLPGGFTGGVFRRSDYGGGFQLETTAEFVLQLLVARLVGLDSARGRIEREREDLLGRVVCDLLDVHPARGRCHHGDPLGAAIDDEGEVQLALDARARLDVDQIYGQPLVSALMSHEPPAEQGFRMPLDLGGRLRELHAAGLAAAARVDLRLHDPDRAAELLGGGLRLGWRARREAFRHRNAVLGEQCLRLVFVEIHRRFVAGMKRGAPYSR